MMKIIIPFIFLLVSCSVPKIKKEIAPTIEHQPAKEVKVNQIPLINHLTKKIQLINFLVANNKYSEAHNEIESLIKKYPKNYVFYDMEGSVHFLEGNQELALKAFEKSLQLNPKNKEARSMIEKTKKQIL